MIFDEDITFVIQGPLGKYINKSVFSIRKYYPKSSIIISTWENENFDNVANCNDIEFVVSKDPGAVSDHVNGSKKDNVNRQIISTSAGLKLVKTKYTVKTRPDIVFKNSALIKYYNKHSQKQIKLFSESILVPNYNVKNPDLISIIFHPSDLLILGPTIDIKNYFNIPLRQKKDSQLMKSNFKPPRDYQNVYSNLLTLHTAESYIFTEYLKKIGFTENILTCFSNSREKKQVWLDLLANNFIVVDPFRLGVRFVKYPLRELKSYYSLTYFEWQRLTNSSVQRTFKIDLERILYLLVKQVYNLFGKSIFHNY
jgi:hypothetical protein